jgi:hypothetical protein
LGNFLAFASVTATISYILEEVNRDIAGIRITTKPLDAVDVQNPVNGLNIFLYLVAPNPSIDAIDTLIKDRAGKPTNNPMLLVDLHYLITATSSENDDLTAQKILASAMRILNEHPVLVRDLIRKAVRNKEGLESSDLADQVEDVRLSLNALSTEDLTKIWSRFPNANFRASIAYVANVVLLESKIIKAAGVVGAIDIERIGQLKTPTIERVEPQILEYAPDASLVILGSSLKGPSVLVEFNDNIRVSPKREEDISDGRIVVPVPEEIEPGILKVTVRHYLAPEKDKQVEEKKPVLKSNSSPFVLAPRILSPLKGRQSRGRELIIEFQPSVSTSKNVYIYLGDTAFLATPIISTVPEGNSKSGRFRFTLPDNIISGVYLVRVAVDGAMSFLLRDGDVRSATYRKFIGPYIEIE